MRMRTIDIICAVRDEEETIQVFVESIHGLKLPESVSVGIIFVEDSSIDNTLNVLRDITRKYTNVKYYSLKEGFGEGPALVLGMKCSRADAVIPMDVDGGHPIASIPEMIDLYQDGADIVQAVRLTLKNRRWYRDLGSTFFKFMIRLITGFDLRKQNVYYRLMSKRCKDIIVRQKKWIHYLHVNLPQNTDYRLERVYFDAEDRKLGKSKYNFLRLINSFALGFLSIISFSRLILLSILLTLAGILAILLGFLYVSLFVFVITIVLVAGYHRIATNTILDKMEIKEQSEDM